MSINQQPSLICMSNSHRSSSKQTCSPWRITRSCLVYRRSSTVHDPPPTSLQCTGPTYGLINKQHVSSLGWLIHAWGLVKLNSIPNPSTISTADTLVACLVEQFAWVLFSSSFFAFVLFWLLPSGCLSCPSWNLNWFFPNQWQAVTRDSDCLQVRKRGGDRRGWTSTHYGTFTFLNEASWWPD